MELSSKKLRELERHEAWLAERADTAPSAQALARVKHAVRQELALQAGRERRTLRPAFGAWAAAAMLLLSAGVVWHAVRSYVAPAAVEMASVQPSLLDQDEAALTELDVELTNLEQGNQYALDNNLDALMTDVEALESENANVWSS